MRHFTFFSARAALFLMAHFQNSQALSQQYCSSENTGSDFASVYNQYQSNGACFQTCLSEYAYAIVQYQECWCSNYAPADQVNTSECNVACPGYGYEDCGNQDQGLYGYIQLTKSPSGTAGASSTAASSTQASSTSQSMSSEYSTTQESTSQQESTSTSDSTSYSSTPTSAYSTTTSSTSPTSSPSSTTSSSSSSSAAVAVVVATSPSATSGSMTTPSPVTTTRIVTRSGAVVTQTVTSTPAPYINPDSEQQTAQRKNVSGGTIAGAVVGSIIGLALLALIAFILLRRRRNKRDSTSSGRLNRNASVLSKAGLLSSARAPDAEKDYDEPATYMSQNPQRHSLLYGDYDDSPISAPAGIYETSSFASRRNSRPLVYDQRLNPHALMQNYDLNGSRASVNTMQDQRDYSRPLGIVNPDVD